MDNNLKSTNQFDSETFFSELRIRNSETGINTYVVMFIASSFSPHTVIFPFLPLQVFRCRSMKCAFTVQDRYEIHSKTSKPYPEQIV